MEAEELKKKIGLKLKQLRKAADFSNYKDFAYFYDLEPNTVRNAETGKNITIDTLIKILSIHGISLKQFFKDFK